MSLTVVASGTTAGVLKTISTSTQATPVEVTTTANHGWLTGQRVRIAGCDVGALNGIWTITVTAVNKFTLDGSTNPAASATTGTVGQEIDLYTTTALGIFILQITLINMVTSDKLDIVDKGKALSGSTQVDRKRTVYSDAQDPDMVYTDPVAVGQQHKFAINQYAGISRNFEWAVLRVQ